MNDDLTPSGERAVRLAIEVAALRATLARVEGVLPDGPRPHVDLHSIGRWEMGQQVRSALASPTGAQGHECGRDFDPSCSGCVTAMSDAFGSDRTAWPS